MPVDVVRTRVVLARIGLIAATLCAPPPCSADEPAPSIRAVAATGGAKIDVAGTNTSAVVVIACESGIGKVRLERVADSWPQAISVRLRLTGLESFLVRRGDVVVQWSVASTPEHVTRVSVRRGKNDDEPIDATSPLYAPVRLVAREPKIPLPNGYFEVRLPNALFAENPSALQLEWIDFYRN